MISKSLYKSLIIAASVSSVTQAQEIFEELETTVVIGDIANMDTIGNGTLAGSYDIIIRDELAYEHPDDTLELFSKVPGVVLSRYNQGIINTDISIRGFAGDGVTPHAKLLIDGIPSNLHNGYNELDQMFSMSIGSMETFKGTSDLRYGLFNIAGNYNVSSRSDLAREIQVTYGSYDAMEVQGYWGLQTGKLTHNYFLGYREANGYRDRTSIEKGTFSGRWFYELDDDTTIGFIARTSYYDADSPGYLDRETAREDPTSSASFANQDGGDKQVNHFSLHFDKAFFDSSLNVSSKAYYQTFERERWVRFSEGGSLGNRYDDQEMTGFITQADWTLNDQWTLRAGLDYEHQDIIEQRFGTIGQRQVRDTSNVSRDRRYDLEIIGGYLGFEHQPVEWLRWNAGVRLDHLDGDIDDRVAGSTGDIFDFGTIVQPKANLFVTLSEDVTAFANVGRSFQHPIGSALYTTTGDRTARDISLNDGWELGAKWQANDYLSLRLSYWEQYAKDEFIDVDGTSRNVGKTKRNGIDLSASWDISDKAKFWGNYSYINSSIDNDGANKNNRLRGVPDYTFSIGGSYQVTEAITTRLHLDGQGSYYVNEANEGGTFGGYTLLNAGVDYKTEHGVISLQLNNILDQDYEYVFDFGNDGTATIHSPGDGINTSLSYTFTF